MSKYTVTFEEYDIFCDSIGYQKPDDEGWGRGKRPVINVNWFDALYYCNWRSKNEGFEEIYKNIGYSVTANWWANGYRLPTEAEWEYAARAGGKRVRFGNGKDVANPDEMNYNGSEKDIKHAITGIYRQKTIPVGSFAPNALGLFDMSGNVIEWCWDWHDQYPCIAQKNPTGPDKGPYPVLRGGSWNSSGERCRSTSRDCIAPRGRLNDVGFRLVFIP
jgi:formylglycine-generating enzyme required for sulfatase activity